ncbi:MAG: hypothetical protein ACI3Y5_09230 [Prevotella sp.]
MMDRFPHIRVPHLRGLMSLDIIRGLRQATGESQKKIIEENYKHFYTDNEIIITFAGGRLRLSNKEPTPPLYT